MYQSKHTRRAASTLPERIHRTQHDRNYTTLSNAPAHSRVLSLDTKGLLWYVLTLPDDWTLYRQQIAKQWGISKRDLARIFRELEEEGHFVRKQENKGRGGFKEVTYDVYEDPRDYRKDNETARKRGQIDTSFASPESGTRKSNDSTRVSESSPPRSADSTHSDTRSRFTDSVFCDDILNTNSLPKEGFQKGKSLRGTYGDQHRFLTNGRTSGEDRTRQLPDDDADDRYPWDR